ncbi:MAG: hypothetical protein ABI114_08985 [Rhodanobacter sp.]
MKPIIFGTFAFALLLPLVGCSQSPQANSDNTAQTSNDAGEKTSSTLLSRKISQGIQKAKQDLATKNIDVNNLHVGQGRHWRSGAHSDAEITPQGDLLISGKKVQATPAQHTLLLDYRQQIVGIAQAGMDIGAQGANLGINAAKQAMLGAFSGKDDKDIEAAIQPQAEKIKAAAVILCQRLPSLLSSQQKLAAAMPEFKPYATMEQKDIDDCGKEMTDKNGKKGFAVFSD